MNSDADLRETVGVECCETHAVGTGNSSNRDSDREPTESPTTRALVLPFPPSVNGMYRSIARGRSCQAILSEKGRAYITAALQEIDSQKPLQGRLQVHVLLCPPDRRKRDLDNYMKGLLDVMTKGNVWIDDSQIDRLQIERGPIQNRCVVTITELTSE